MEDFGKRLKEERERIGLSQARFAELCGVGRTAQFNYERGERHPSSVYLDAAEKLGVDTLYVMTATRKGKDWDYARACNQMLYTIEMLLGLEENRLEDIAGRVVALEQQLDQRGQTHADEWISHLRNWLGTTSRLESVVDAALLARLLDDVTRVAEEGGVALSTEKRLRAALMLYPDAKKTGEIDARRTTDAVKLAS